MKTTLVLFICCISLLFCRSRTEQAKPGHTIAALRTDSINFKTQIQPILERNCAPCHFPGGKMYEKLPFDKGETIVNHEVTLLRRIKDEKEKALIQKFIVQQKK